MNSPALIALSPYRANIFYTVQPYLVLEELATSLADELKSDVIDTPKTIIFCRKLEDTALLYMTLKQNLGYYFTYPAGYPDVQQFRLVDMYTRACRTEFKEAIIRSFTLSQSVLRIVLATTAFGMGIDCPNIHRIIHWGPPANLEQYLQETGRAGRDGKQAEAILLFGKASKYVEEDIHVYANVDKHCRRQKLYKNFLFYDNECNLIGCKCCDVCARVCTCDECKV